jgi:(p)ppGpp synthase/HD superfamily hydrolase
VASLLFHSGAQEDVVTAGVLHDVIEKTDIELSDIRLRFGTRVAALVAAVSEDGRIPAYAERKAALRDQAASGGEEALLLFAADKVSKARKLRLHPHAARHRHRRLGHYRDCLRLLDEQLPRAPLVRALERELEALSRAMPERALTGAH